MTYPSEPTRWTHSPEEAPELLRGAFEACRREGPSELQMRTLALKLAALSSGAAVAASAASAKAATLATGSGTAGAAGGTSMLSFAKVAVSLALLGAAATGTVLLQRAHPATDARHGERGTPAAQQADAPIVIETGPSTSSVSAPELGRQVAPALTPEVRPLAQASATAETNGLAREPTDEGGPAGRAGSAIKASERKQDRFEGREGRTESAGRASRRTHRVSSAAKRADAIAKAARKREESAVQREEPTAKRDETPVSDQAAEGTPSEIELLRNARAALDARPRQAFRTTEQHRSLYPQGVFAQERDALAVEALARAGDLKLARELAEAFIRRYPSSPHAHRFRETMNLQ